MPKKISKNGLTINISKMISINNIIERLTVDELTELQNIVLLNLCRKTSLLDMRIEDLEISSRCYTLLKRYNLNTLRQVAEIEKGEILKFRNFGKRTYDELTELLLKNGLNWKQKTR